MEWRNTVLLGEDGATWNKPRAVPRERGAYLGRKWGRSEKNKWKYPCTTKSASWDLCSFPICGSPSECLQFNRVSPPVPTEPDQSVSGKPRLAPPPRHLSVCTRIHSVCTYWALPCVPLWGHRDDWYFDLLCTESGLQESSARVFCHSLFYLFFN